MLEIAKGFFSALDVRQLLELPSEKNDRFFDLWTLKEAYIKARGMGLVIPFNSFSYSFSEENIEIVFHWELDEQAELWGLWQIIPSEKHKIALVIKKCNINKTYAFNSKKASQILSDSLLLIIVLLK